MRKILSVALLSALTLLSCGKSDTPEQMLADAGIELDSHDYDSARAILDRLMADSTAMNSMNVKQLVTAAQLYTTIALAENNQSSETDEASAARCLTCARDIDPDSVDSYVNALEAEAAHHLRTISSVSAYLGLNRDSIITNEEPDSVM
ncbi:MAG: hypothetical protein K2M19_07375 [Muribaculaceae bacterium]|nr:hypothetical protein [Muribaculaceae bacterium]